MFSAQLTNMEASFSYARSGNEEANDEFDHNIRKHLVFENENSQAVVPY